MPVSAAAEAAMITAAPHAHAVGLPAAGRPHPAPGRTDLRSHATWLAAVSAAMPPSRSRPLPRAISHR
jgi:hypothetical protein